MMLDLYFEQVKNDPPDIISDCLKGSPYGSNCGICTKNSENAKILPCLHIFCQQCLIDYIPPQSLAISCPCCKQPFILPESGIYGLQSRLHTTSDFFTDNISCKNIKNNSHHSYTNQIYNDSLDNLEENDLFQIPDHKCIHHNGQDLQFYCRDCEILICVICSNVEHSEHSTTLLQDTIKSYKITLKNSSYKAKQQMKILEKTVKNIHDVVNQFSSTRSEIETQINTTCNNVIKLITERKTKLLSQLDYSYNVKQQHLQKQKEYLEHTCSNIDNCCLFIENILSNGNEAEIFLVNHQLSKKLSDYSNIEVQKISEKDEYLLYKENNLSLIVDQCKNWGQITIESIAHCDITISGEGLKHCLINQPMSVLFVAKDEFDKIIKVGKQLIKAEVISNDGSSHQVDILENSNGTYKLTYSVPKKRHYKFNIFFNGQHISGSPFKLSVLTEEETTSSSDHHSSSKIPRLKVNWLKQSKILQNKKSCGSNSIIDDDLLLRIGERGCKQGEFSNPQGIAYGRGGQILIADSSNQTVQLFSKDGEFKAYIGSRGRSSGQIQRPTGVTIMANGKYIVADYTNKWISIFDTNYKYIKRIGVGKLLGPKGVAVDKNGRIIVVDNKSSNILIFLLNGKLVKKIGNQKNTAYNLAGPHFVTVNEDNDIFVSDFHNHQVKVFNSDGIFQFSFGSNGEGNGQFNCPTGLAIDKMGNILVADWGNNRIQIFDHAGSFLSYVNTSIDPLYGPQGLSITEDNHVIVADSGNHCFKIYKYLQ